MKTPKRKISFKVTRAVGSLAIEGITVPRSTKAAMLQIARGLASAKDIKNELIPMSIGQPSTH